MSDLLERLGTKFTVGDGCWEWHAGHTTLNYGMVRMGPRMRMAHRVVYELMVGPIPEGLVLDHLCRNPKCVRPGHLEPVTDAENLRRGIGVGVFGAEMQRAKTHCPHGHEYTEENIVMSHGSRHCRTCRNEHKRRRRSEARHH